MLWLMEFMMVSNILNYILGSMFSKGRERRRKPGSAVPMKFLRAIG